ncbi:related to CCC2 - copper resistance-associated P-type ATPase [Ustilago trichophora]|uniref:Related to CCC2 - copper resistance-associated P-type ATPase n=1 Tax=Ustilago trichophora TaxID=86804 RepID=A0A5C3E2V5_9BASI|nr:related to CCC2 - copper resistance-associated P-type ATPase [Ustilago trichophora]
MTLSRHANRGGSAQDQERVPLLQSPSTALTPHYNAIDGTDDDHQRPLITRGTGQSSRIGQSSSDLVVRVQAICPNIHCPSCISHLSSLVSTLSIDDSSHTRIANVDTSLIDRSVNFDLIISNVGATSQPRAVSKLLVRILSEVATILAEDGFPVDHLRSKLASATPSHRRYKDALNLVLDAPDLCRKRPSSPAAHSLPEDGRVGTNFEAAKSHSILGTFPASFGSTLRSAWSRSNAADQSFARLQEERWRKHVQICEACRAGISEGIQGHASLLSQSDSRANLGATDDADRRVLATLSIAGMTCASCAQSITKAVQAETLIPIDSIEVNVMSASATVITHPSAVDKVAETIDDAGFEAQVIKTEPVPRPRKQDDAGFDSQWTGKLSVQGMTCASCVQSITSALNSFSEETNSQNAVKILETSINLMGKSADIKLSSDASEEVGKEDVEKRLRDIISEIEDIGFDAELLTVQQKQSNDAAHRGIGRTAEDGSLPRSVRIKVEGMFCQNCVTKVRDYFIDMQDEHRSNIEVDEDDLEAFNLSKPFLSFRYTSGPNSKIRLRDVLEDVNRLDPSFQAHYSPPASLASRSAVLARKELRDLLLRLSIAALFAIPSLVISMIAPVLPPDHPLRRYLSEYVVGSATKGEVAMWIISTPVQFGVGSIFFKKAWRSLSSVWKRGRSWTDRFLRFGNMDVLVALGTLVAYTSSLTFLVIDAFRTPQVHPVFRLLSSNKGKDGDSMQNEMGMTYFEVSVFLVFFILLGRALESISKKKTGDAVADLGKMKPSSAYLVLDPTNPAQSKTKVVDVDMLEIDDMVLVPFGASPPLDGSFAGTSTGKEDAQGLLDESSLSGEARPVSKEVGDNVFAGTISVSPTAIFARVGVLPGSCMIDEILDVVQESAGKKASIAQLADKITGVFVPVIVYISLSVFLLWTVLLYSGVLSESWQARHVPHYGEPGARLLWALQFGISCLLVACPCGIGLAAPTSQLAGIGLASKHGILVNGGGEAFRAASAAARGSTDLVVVFDKTGTITKGEAVKVTAHRFSITFGQSPGASNDAEALDQETLLRLMDLVEQSSTHPYASAVRGFVAERLGQSKPTDAAAASLPKLVDVSEVAGKGIRATFEGQSSSFLLLIGNKRLMDEMEGACSRMDSSIKAAEQDWWAATNSVLYVGYQPPSSPGEICLAVAISDVIRPEASWVIHHLKQRFGAEVWMVSGDNEATARGVASQVGIPASQVVAGVLPVQKKEWVERLQFSPSQRELEHPSPPEGRSSWWRRSQSKQRLVCFIGDGINDSPALSSASLGIALGSGSSIAHSSSDFILLRRRSPLLSLPLLLTLSDATYLKIWTNFAWAFVFNLCLIPIAAGALVGLGVGLGPALSGLAMAFSSTSVVLNSLTLRWWRPEKEVRKRIEESEQQE